LRRLLTGELRPVQVGIQPVRGEQVGVLTLFDDPATVNDEDLLGLSDCRQAVRDDERSAGCRRGRESKQ